MAFAQTNFTPLHSQKAEDSNSDPHGDRAARSPCLMPRQTEGFLRGSDGDVSLLP